GAGATANRVLRRLEPRAHRQGGLDGGIRGRPAQALGLPAVRDQGSARSGRFRKHGGDAPAALREAPGRARVDGGPAATIRLPSVAGRRRRGARPALGGHEGAGGGRPADPGRRPGQAPRGGLRPRSSGPAQDPSRLGGAVRPATHPGRGASLRDHVSPGQAREAADRVSAGRRPRDRPRTQEGAAPPLRIARSRHGRLRRGDRRDAGRRPGARPDRARAPARPDRERSAPRRNGPPATGERLMSQPAKKPRNHPNQIRSLHREAQPPGFTIITGLSGAGRSETAKCLEDLGYFVVDNLPPALLPKMAELASRPGAPGRVGVVVDARGGVFFEELSKALEELHSLSIPYRIVYLEASDEDLVNRYAATRHRHPLAPADRVIEGIRKERLMMESLRGEADLILDTSGLTPHELRERLRDAFSDAPPEAHLQVSIISFGYKYGTPRDADLVIDVRFLPNPHWIDELRPL